MSTLSCPICGRAMDGGGPAQWPAFPFCSPRCKTVDLGRWLSESYALPRLSAAEPEDASEEEGDQP